MPEQAGMSNGQKGGWLAGLVSAVLVAVLASGSRPWWLGGEAKPESKGPAPIREGTQPAPAPQPARVELPESATPKPQPTPPADSGTVVSPEFIVGRWRAEQDNGAMRSSAIMTYFSNGRCEGFGTQVVGYMAQPVSLSGYWRMQKVTDKLFRLEWRYDNGNVDSASFKLLDKDHVQNLDMNYVAERVE